MPHDGQMSDDIERLLAQVSGTTGNSGAVDKKASAPAKRASDKPGGRLPFALIAAVVFGAVAFVIGWLFTPFVLSGTSLGLGAAVGSFVTALIAGPPRWFSS